MGLFILPGCLPLEAQSPDTPLPSSPPHAYSQTEVGEYVEALIQKANRHKLHEERYWRLLLHYLPQKGSTESEADGLDFFFTADGYRNPRAELRATLWALFDAPDDHARNMHPQCQFPARFHWLKKKLSFDLQKTPQIRCPGLELWLRILDYSSVSLVFASYFLNAPASAFGHTLLKINSRKYQDFDLLAYAINFSAFTGDIDPIRYALYGLLGGFEGRFAFLPYHAKVREYNDIESRDLWEYRLNLNKEEILRMLLHAWEMDQTYFDYYFAKENCSYHILSLLEIARPQLSLRSRFTWATLPLETIKLLFENDLVERTVYRPSTDTTLKQRIGQLNPSEKEIFFSALETEGDLTESEFMQLSQERKIFLLDTLLTALRTKTEFQKEGPQKKYYETLLQERTKLPPTQEYFEGKPENSPPHLGHPPRSLSFLGGTSSYGSFVGMNFRPILHEFLNANEGYPRNAELLFLNFDLRWYEEQSSPTLYRLDLLRLLSLVPYEPYKRSLSYSIRLGMESAFFKEEDQKGNSIQETLRHTNVGEAEGLAGFTWEGLGFSWSTFALLGGALYRYAPEHFQDQNILSPAAGGIFVLDVGDWKGQFLLQYYPFSVFYREGDELRAALRLRYAFAQNLEGILELGSRKNYEQALFTLVSYF